MRRWRTGRDQRNGATLRLIRVSLRFPLESNPTRVTYGARTIRRRTGERSTLHSCRVLLPSVVLPSLYVCLVFSPETGFTFGCQFFRARNWRNWVEFTTLLTERPEQERNKRGEREREREGYQKWRWHQANREELGLSLSLSLPALTSSSELQWYVIWISLA